MKKVPGMKGVIRFYSQPRTRVTPEAVAMVELMTHMFLKNLAAEARAEAFEDRCATIKMHHLKAVTKKQLKRTRG